jgi:hypothetical protein
VVSRRRTLLRDRLDDEGPGLLGMRCPGYWRLPRRNGRIARPGACHSPQADESRWRRLLRACCRLVDRAARRGARWCRRTPTRPSWAAWSRSAAGWRTRRTTSTSQCSPSPAGVAAARCRSCPAPRRSRSVSQHCGEHTSPALRALPVGPSRPGLAAWA